jgi:phage FluMu protein Com
MKLCIALRDTGGMLVLFQAGSMPYWMLKCPECSRDFVHTKIEVTVIEEARRDPFQILPRPTFAQGGENHACPGCKTESVFQRQQLFYRDDTPDFDF